MQQAADAIGIDKSTLSRWVQLGRVKSAFKAPGPRGVLLFDPSEVERVRADKDGDDTPPDCCAEHDGPHLHGCVRRRYVDGGEHEGACLLSS